jgi:hypothetical protein
MVDAWGRALVLKHVAQEGNRKFDISDSDLASYSVLTSLLVTGFESCSYSTLF